MLRKDNIPPEAKQKALERLQELRNKYPAESDWDLLILALAEEMLVVRGQEEEIKEQNRAHGQFGVGA